MARTKDNRMMVLVPERPDWKPESCGATEIEELVLTAEEWESIRLADLKGLSYPEAGKRMNISRIAFGQLIGGARKTIADALINGKTVSVEGVKNRRRRPIH